MPWQQEPRIQFVCDQLRASPLPVRLLPDRTAERFLRCGWWRPARSRRWKCSARRLPRSSAPASGCSTSWHPAASWCCSRRC
ncbi:hypothetical protein QIH80_28890 [Bradyrhizobium elkanii]|nr:hypothetical protein QIH80_28890 [Bradyrhizobium elkanii]